MMQLALFIGRNIKIKNANWLKKKVCLISLDERRGDCTIKS